MKTFSTLFIVIFYCVFISNIQQTERHLIIMSGQSNMVHLDPNESFIPILKKEFGDNSLIIVKDAKGAQPISRWYKKAKPNQNELQIGDLYDQLFSKTIDSIADFKIKSVTFIWMQGERDAKLRNADTYENHLKGLYHQLSKDLDRNDINFIIGRLNDFDMTNAKWPDWTKIRDIQVKVAESNPRFDWIDTDDFNTGIGLDSKKVVNDIHMSKKGYFLLGEAFAEKTIQLIKYKK